MALLPVPDGVEGKKRNTSWILMTGNLLETQLVTVKNLIGIKEILR